MHYPGTYLAGVYNRVRSEINGRVVEDEHLVNAPNWLCLDIRTPKARWWSEGGLSVRQERRDLDLRRAVLTRQAVLVDDRGRRLQLQQRRLVSMQHPHLASLETTVVPDGWSGRISVWSGIDAGVTNSNVVEYQGLERRHLTEVTCQEPESGVLVVQAVTSQSDIRIAVAARTSVEGAAVASSATEGRDPGGHGNRLEIDVVDGQPVVIEKVVAFVTSRDAAIASPMLGALSALNRAPRTLAEMLPGHQEAWDRLWARSSMRMDVAPVESQLVLNLHMFHLLQTVSSHSAELDAGLPARGLHGEGYRGHVFWDELFVVPVLAARIPRAARALLEYRWRRLDIARAAADDAGLKGALFPWQSGSDGREETPAQLFNVRSGRWMPDNSRLQRHVGLAVAFNAWQYYQMTGDFGWLAARGAELIIEVARLFTSLSTYDVADDRFHITGVMGPDEYHDGYPDGSGGGLRDNAYTNVLAAWVCARAVDVLDVLAGHLCEDLRGRLRIGEEEPGQWARVSRRMTVPFHDGRISQFDGYDALQELDWSRYRRDYGDISRLDLILEAEGDSSNRYKLSKQADVLMLIYLLGPGTLGSLLDQLGYPADEAVLSDTVDYYLARTVHGSTLSRVVHASVLSRMDPSRAWGLFREALAADLDDTQGGTTQEGIHLGAMAGTIDILTRTFAGMRMDNDQLAFMPRLPVQLGQLEFQIRYRGQCVDVLLNHDRLRLTTHTCTTAAGIHVTVDDTAATLRSAQSMDFPIARGR